MFQTKVAEKFETRTVCSITVWRMRIACWIPKATNTHSQYVILLKHCNNGYTNAPQCYVIRTLPVLLRIVTDSLTCRKSDILCLVRGVRAIQCFQQDRQGEPQRLLIRSDNEKRNETQARFGCIKARNTGEVIGVIGIGTGCHICVTFKNVAGYSVVSIRIHRQFPVFRIAFKPSPHFILHLRLPYLFFFLSFFCAFAKLRKATVVFVVSICPSAGKNSASTGQIFMKFYIWGSVKSVARKATFD